MVIDSILCQYGVYRCKICNDTELQLAENNEIRTKTSLKIILEFSRYYMAIFAYVSNLDGKNNRRIS